MNLDDIPSGVLVAIVSSAVGGYIGGLIVGTKANLTVSALIGAIVGLSVGTVLKLLEVDPIFDVEGYSLVYTFVVGAATSWVISKAS